MAQWVQCNFIQTVPTWADAACNISDVDTHDGFDSRKHDHEKRRESKEQLREMLHRAVDPEAFLAPPAEAVELAAPFVRRLESGTVRIDWQGIEREAKVRARLYAYAAEYERERIELEEDEEDINILTVWI